VITVSIGGASFPLERVSEGWVNQMISEARRLNQSLCVRIDVQEESAHVVLSTPGCGTGGGGGRMPTPTERRILDEWNRRGLNSNEFSPGQLQAFLRELARLT
jgi:hypothetical protein